MAHQTQAQTSITEPTNKNPKQQLNKRRSSVRQLTDALESGRAEAKPGAIVELGGVPIGEASRAGRALAKSLRASAPRRAAAKAKGRAYKARTAKRSGGR